MLYKELGHKAQLAAKLMLNSMYGKLIQQKGYKIEEDGTEKPPPFFSLTYATFITGITRARILQTIIDNNCHMDDSIIAIETDCK